MSVTTSPDSPFIRINDRTVVTRRRNSQPQHIAFLSPERRGTFSQVNRDLPTTYDFSHCNIQSGVSKGTLIRTSDRDVPVENLKVGDLVFTGDRGAQPIRYINVVEVPATPDRAAVRIADGALGNVGDLIVSPDFRVILLGGRSKTIAGSKEVLTAAQHLVNDRDITWETRETITYYSLAFDRHEVILANSTAVESLHPEIEAERAMPDELKLQLRAAFRKHRARVTIYGALTRPEVKPYEARLIRP